MEKNYWLGRWSRGETGWHQLEVEPALTGWMKGKSNRRIFVPLCGKSKDMKWLLDQGHTVVGCELSLQACEEFFQENGIAYETEERRELKVFHGDRITLFGGDIFALEASDIGIVDRIYDRAALIALPHDLRQKYASHLLRLVEPSLENQNFEHLQLVLERTPSDANGPPFSVSPIEVESHYGGRFKLNLLSRELVEAEPLATSRVEECVMLLQPSLRMKAAPSRCEEV